MSINGLCFISLSPKVTRKEFASAALLKMITFLMDEIAQEKKAREEIKEVIEDLEERLKHQEEKNQIAQDSNGQFPNGRRSESKERRPGSCRDLQQAGHSLSGFYIVRGSQRIEIVFCPFNDDKGKFSTLYTTTDYSLIK